jgi:hypothetical protein
MNKLFYENVKLNSPMVLLQYDGTLLDGKQYKIKPKEPLVNQMIIPYGKKRQLRLSKRVLRMIRVAEAYLLNDFIVTLIFQRM